MRRPLLFLFFVAYIAAAVYSIGRTGPQLASPNKTYKASFKPGRLSLNRVTLTTANLPALAHFYNEVFHADLQPNEQADDAALACQSGALSGVRFLLCPATNTKSKLPKPAPWRFQVTDIAAAIKAVENAGGTIEGEITERIGAKFITVRDPDGNALELAQPLQNQ